MAAGAEGPAEAVLGLYPSNFRETLLFGKLSVVLGDGAALDVSGNLRHETDIRGFGNQTSFQSAEDAKNDAGTAVAKHTLLKGNFLNEATLSYQRSKWNPIARKPGPRQPELLRPPADRREVRPRRTSPRTGTPSATT